jgi:hypothetical protein
MTRGRRQKLRNGDEWDVVYKAPLCVFNKPGLKKKTKRRMNKRYRKEGRWECKAATQDV